MSDTEGISRDPLTELLVRANQVGTGFRLSGRAVEK
jgi:hypothetical protein